MARLWEYAVLKALDPPKVIDHDGLQWNQILAFAFVVVRPGDSRPSLQIQVILS